MLVLSFAQRACLRWTPATHTEDTRSTHPEHLHAICHALFGQFLQDAESELEWWATTERSPVPVMRCRRRGGRRVLMSARRRVSTRRSHHHPREAHPMVR